MRLCRHESIFVELALDAVEEVTRRWESFGVCAPSPNSIVPAPYPGSPRGDTNRRKGCGQVVRSP